MTIYIILIYKFWLRPGIHMGDRLSVITSVWTMTSSYTTKTNGLVLFPADDRGPLQLSRHCSQHQHAPERPSGPDPPPRATASPAKPLDDLLHLPPETAPVQEANDLVKDKPLEAAVAPEQ
jgi:hypothetical protein